MTTVSPDLRRYSESVKRPGAFYLLYVTEAKVLLSPFLYLTEG